MRQNTLAEKLVGIALRQLQVSYLFKLPRMTRIRQYRALYLNEVERQKRVRYNAPIPFFSGMMDTKLADLNDSVILKYEEQDPADYLSCVKANAALHQEMESTRPGARWNQKFRQARQECGFSGRGFFEFNASNDNGFETTLESPPFEDMFFEPKGGPLLEDHLFRGRINHWQTKKQILESDFYNKSQAKLLTGYGGTDYKFSNIWNNFDYANRFTPLGISAEANNYVGEEMFNLIKWELKYENVYWYLVFEPYGATWLFCDKLSEVNSGGHSHWMSFASHEDSKNFASKSFADDIYPISYMATDMTNEYAENVRRRNSRARAYDKDMFPDVAALDLAQLGRDRLVPVDTKGGVRKIAEGLFQFETPDISGTLDFTKYLEDLVGRNYGVTEGQKGDNNPNKPLGVVYSERVPVAKRLTFEGQPMIEAGQELGVRFWGALKDYLKEPLSIKMLGENGYEWTQLKRVDLNIKKDFKITVASKNQMDQMNALAAAEKRESLENILKPVDPAFKGNIREVNKARLMQGGWTESEADAFLDPNSTADKRTIAETAEAIELLMRGKMPPTNYDATGYFIQKIVDFMKTHQEDAKVKKTLPQFAKYVQAHLQIAAENESRHADNDIQTMNRTQPAGVPIGAPAGVPPAPQGVSPMPPNNTLPVQ